MAGIFPQSNDGGLPPNANDPNNPKAAYPPVTAPSGTAALYYGNGCDVRLRPEVLNSLISEIEAVVDQAGLAYNPNFRENLDFATRYLIQRGLARSALMTGGPQNYNATLDPPMTAYNNFLTLTVVPAVTNINVVTLNVDSKGAVYILRNDGGQLEAGDLLANVPYIIAYVNGAFYLCGLASSQVPIVKKGGIDAWIRTDGNDTLGDGTANTPEKAFKTIAGCWSAVGSRYAASPSFSINMKFGIPGRYDGAVVGPFGGQVTLTGDESNPGAYIIAQVEGNAGFWFNFQAQNLSAFAILGVTMVQEKLPPNQCSMLRVIASNILMSNCIFDILVSNPNSLCVEDRAGSFTLACSSLSQPVSIMTVNGHGNQLGYIFSANTGGTLEGATGLIPGLSAYYHFNDLRITQYSTLVSGLAVLHFGSATGIVNTNCTGIKYGVTENSILNMGGKILPGDVEGTATYGGQYIP